MRETKRSTRLLIAAAVGSIAAFGLSSIAHASSPTASTSALTVIDGTVQPATGSPRPASGTQVVLWSNHSVATTTVDGVGRIAVGAIGDYCDGWPRISATVDGKMIGTTVIVSSTHYGSYPVGAAVGAGHHTVAIGFVNDFRNSGCDRNVRIGFVGIDSPTGTVVQPAPTAAPVPVTTAPKPVPVTTAPVTTTAPGPTSAPLPTAAPTSQSPVPTEVVDPPSEDTPEPAPPTTSSPVASPPGDDDKPGPGNTGVPAGTKLTVYQGDLVITKPGTVIDSLDIHGFVRVEADHVTIRRSLVRGRYTGTAPAALVASYDSNIDLTVEDSTLRADQASPYVDGIKGSNYTADRLDVSNVVDTAQVFGNNVIIRNSWFHDTSHFSPWALQPDNQTHNDNLQIEGGNNILVQHNTFEKATNTAIMITQNFARSSGIVVTDNWLSGGDCTVNIAEKGQGPVQSTFTDNRFGPGDIANCAILAKPTSDPTMSDDVWDATSLPVELRYRST